MSLTAAQAQLFVSIVEGCRGQQELRIKPIASHIPARHRTWSADRAATSYASRPTARVVTFAKNVLQLWPFKILRPAAAMARRRVKSQALRSRGRWIETLQATCALRYSEVGEKASESAALRQISIRQLAITTGRTAAPQRSEKTRRGNEKMLHRDTQRCKDRPRIRSELTNCIRLELRLFVRRAELQ
jgi:hypothetical protein